MPSHWNVQPFSNIYLLPKSFSIVFIPFRPFLKKANVTRKNGVCLMKTLALYPLNKTEKHLKQQQQQETKQK